MMQRNDREFFTKSFFISGMKVLSFIIVLALLLELFSVTLFSKKAATQYKNAFSKSYSFTTEPENSIDIALIGSSDLYSGFVPVKIWDRYGYTSTVISTPKQTVERSSMFLDELLKTQSPRLIVFETDMFYAGVPVKGIDGDTQQVEVIHENKMKTIIKTIGNAQIGENIENHFTVFMFHDAWKKLNIKALTKMAREKNSVTCEHGYNFNKIIFPTKDNNRMDFTDELEEIPQENLPYIKRMLDVCRENNIKAAFIEMPSLTSWSYARHNAVSKLAQDNNIPFIDLNSKEIFNKTQIKCESDFRDDGNHLNYFGAVKATRYLGEMIYDTYDDILTDRRADESFAYWQQSSEDFKEKYNAE